MQPSFCKYRPLNNPKETKIPVADHSTTGKDKKLVNLMNYIKVGYWPLLVTNILIMTLVQLNFNHYSVNIGFLPIISNLNALSKTKRLAPRQAPDI